MILGQMKCSHCGRTRNTSLRKCICGYNPRTGKVEKEVFATEEIKPIEKNSLERRAREYTDKVAPLMAHSSGLVYKAYIDGANENYNNLWRNTDVSTPENDDIIKNEIVLLHEKPFMMAPRFVLVVKSPYLDYPSFPNAVAERRVINDNWCWVDVNRDKTVSNDDVIAWMPIPYFKNN